MSSPRFTLRTIATLALAIAYCVAPLAAPSAAATELGSKPVSVVEFYTAQGCDPCRPANASLAALDSAGDVLILTFPVAHWDYLGWRDTFARPEFTARQRAYAVAMGQRGLKTPQIVVNGARAESGAGAVRVHEVVAAAPTIRHAGVSVRPVSARRVTFVVEAGPTQRQPADIWLIGFDPRPIAVTPQRGENAGEPVLHRNVVRELRRVGSWTGAAHSVEVECAQSCVAIVQEPRGGPLLGVALHHPSPAMGASASAVSAQRR